MRRIRRRIRGVIRGRILLVSCFYELCIGPVEIANIFLHVPVWVTTSITVCVGVRMRVGWVRGWVVDR